MRGNKLGRKVVILLLGCGVTGTACLLPLGMAAQERASSGGVIRGTVRSTEGNPLYGILVKARGEGKNNATSVVTDGNGQYEFPVLPLGEYQVSVGTEWKENLRLGASGARQDFSVKLGPDFINQITGSSWSRLISGRPAPAACRRSPGTISGRPLAARIGTYLFRLGPRNISPARKNHSGNIHNTTTPTPNVLTVSARRPERNPRSAA